MDNDSESMESGRCLKDITAIRTQGGKAWKSDGNYCYPVATLPLFALDARKNLSYGQILDKTRAAKRS